MRMPTALALAGLIIFGCITKEHKSADQISGAYVREYSFKVANPESEAEIGMRRIRDTIFIRAIEDEYEVSNKKWRKNDYDLDGWQSMEHSDDRPLPIYKAKFDPSDSSLQSELMVPLYLKDGHLYRGKDRGEQYSRVQ